MLLSERVADGLKSAFLPAVRALGRSAIPARLEASASRPLQVQHA